MTVTKPVQLSLYVLFVLLISLSGSARGQSIDIGAPSPVHTSEVVGRIVARDLGDARLTDHFYAFAGNPGDLLLTVESRNLNGDIDVFTAVGLKPLLKFSVYAESSEPITKGVFLRRRVDLILRVEARTPNDDEGTYQIRFGGSFEPLATGPFLAEAERPAEESVTSTSRPGDKVRRVSSVGARIKEAEPSPAEVAVAPTPEPTPAATPEKPTEMAAENPTNAEATNTTPTKNVRSRRPSSRRTNSRPPAETRRSGNEDARAVDDQPAEKTAESAESAEASSPSSSTRSKPKRGTARAAEPPAQPEPEPDAGPRLVIETREGTLIDRFMSTVRRVMVENGQVVVVGKDGRVERVRLSEVVRMSIAP